MTGIYVDDINEKTSAHGVEIDGVTLKDGNLVPSTAGKGVDFSVNSSQAGMTSELLDHYEEGTYTPTWVSTGLSLTVASSSGTYTRIGRVVFVTILISTTGGATGTTSNQLTINLPIQASASQSGGAVFGEFNNFNLPGTAAGTPMMLAGKIGPSATHITLSAFNDDNYFNDVNGSAITGNCTFRCSATYIC